MRGIVDEPLGFSPREDTIVRLKDTYGRAAK